jgi:hypothetical protein
VLHFPAERKDCQQAAADLEIVGPETVAAGLWRPVTVLLSKGAPAAATIL